MTEASDTVQHLRKLRERLNDRKSRVAELRDLAQPYLGEADEVPPHVLIATIENVRDDMQKLEEKIPSTRVAASVDTGINSLSDDIDHLHTELTTNRGRFLQRQFDHLLTNVRSSLEEIQTELEPCRNVGQRIENPDAILDEISALRSEIHRTSRSRMVEYLSSDKVETLSHFREQLDSQEAFVEAKRDFDTRFVPLKQDVQRLRQEAEPILEYEIYLTQPKRSKLTPQLSSLESNLQRLKTECNLSLLSKADKQAIDDLESDISEVRSHLDGYNETFVARQRSRYADLFQNVGPDNLTLTDNQQRVVIRNDVYNQVVAGAGTGKTLALIYRVAYLVLRRDVDPSRIAVVTLTNKATDEIRTRLADRFDIAGVTVETLHSFGLDLISDATTEPIEIASGDLQNLLHRLINDDGHESFKRHLRQFVHHDQAEYLDESDFETRADYIAERANKEYLTLAGEEVASRAETPSPVYITEIAVDSAAIA